MTIGCVYDWRHGGKATEGKTMNTTEFIPTDEGEGNVLIGYYYPSHEEEIRRCAEFWDGIVDGSEGGLWAPPNQWEKRHKTWTLVNGVWDWAK